MAPNRRPLPHETVVDAGVAAVAPSPTNAQKNFGARVIEEAMGKAILDAMAEGISINDPRIKERMMAARKAARDGRH